MTLAERIVMARKHAGLTQAVLAKLVGVSQQAITKLETGKSESSRVLTKIAGACGVRPEWLDEESGPMVGAELHVKDEQGTYEAAPQSQSQPAQLDTHKLQLATEYLEGQFALRRRVFVPSQHIALLTEVYDFLLRTPAATTVVLGKHFGNKVGSGNEREGTVGSTESADRGGNRRGAGKATAAAGRRK